MRLKLRESGRENSNQEIQEKNERNEEIECEEDRAFESFLSHVIEGEVAEHPGVEDLQSVCKGLELTWVEDDHGHASEQEHHETSETQEVCNVGWHLADYLEQRADSASGVKEVDELDPRWANHNGEVNGHPGIDDQITEIIESLEPGGVVVGDYLKGVDAVNERVPNQDHYVQGWVYIQHFNRTSGESLEDWVENNGDWEENGERLEHK